MSDRARLALGFVVVFALGCLCGAAGYRIVDSHRQVTLFDATSERGKHGMYLWSLEQKLSLRDKQRADIEKILIAHDPELRAITQTSEPQVKAVRQKIRVEIRSVLDASQQTEFDALMTRYDEAKQAR